MAKKTKKEWIEWFNSFDDDIEIEFKIAYSKHSENGKLKKINYSFLKQIMKYEQKYKEALERARKLYERGTITESLGHVFPELKESEEERIRKGLIKYFKNFDSESLYTVGLNEEEILVWLEKQGTVIKDTISMDVNSETEWDDIDKFLRMNLDGEKVKLLIVREE